MYIQLNTPSSSSESPFKKEKSHYPEFVPLGKLLSMAREGSIFIQSI